LTYLITFACYGCHLHGDDSGSVDRAHNVPGGPLLEPDPKRLEDERKQMQQVPYTMDIERREVVLAALVERCAVRGWTMLAAHVRTSHLHLVIESEVRPERIMNDLKSYASRKLNEAGFDKPQRRRWSRHGSTRWLWSPESISTVVRYVVHEQGDPMAVFETSHRD
jgi:REP element-mobilizing transposase RayT